MPRTFILHDMINNNNNKHDKIYITFLLQYRSFSLQLVIYIILYGAVHLKYFSQLPLFFSFYNTPMVSAYDYFSCLWNGPTISFFERREFPRE